MSGASAYEELHREAELQGLRVHLESEYERRPARLKRIVVLEADPDDPDGVALREVAALRITPARGLERTSAALVAFLRARRAAETT